MPWVCVSLMLSLQKCFMSSFMCVQHSFEYLTTASRLTQEIKEKNGFVAPDETGCYPSYGWAVVSTDNNQIMSSQHRSA